MISIGKLKIAGGILGFSFTSELDQGGFILVWGYITIGVSFALLYLRYRLHKVFSPIGLPKLKAFFRGPKFCSPLTKNRELALKGPKIFFLIHTIFLIVAVIGGVIAKNFRESAFRDIVLYLISVCLYFWLHLEIKKYI